MRRDMIDAVGGYDETFRGMYEDQVFHAKVCLEVAGIRSNDSLVSTSPTREFLRGGGEPNWTKT